MNLNTSHFLRLAFCVMVFVFTFIVVSCDDPDPDPDPDPLPGSLQFTLSSDTVWENDGSILIWVSRTGGSDGLVEVNYYTSNGSASAGSDYVSASSSLGWADGDSSSKLITISIINNSLFENDETFYVDLSSPTNGASLGSPVYTTITIWDDDPSLPTSLANETPTSVSATKEFECNLSNYWSAVVVSYYTPSPSDFDLHLRSTPGGSNLINSSLSTVADLIVIDGNNSNAVDPYYIEADYYSGGGNEIIERSNASFNTVLDAPAPGSTELNTRIISIGHIVECCEVQLNSGQTYTFMMRLANSVTPNANIMVFRPTSGSVYYDNAITDNGYRVVGTQVTTSTVNQQITAPVSGFYGVVMFLQYETTDNATFWIDISSP